MKWDSGGSFFLANRLLIGRLIHYTIIKSLPTFCLLLSFRVFVSKREMFRLQVWKVEGQLLGFWQREGIICSQG
jgi:hypothetical protein